MAGTRWQENELDYLQSNYDIISCNEIAKQLGRTTRSVQHKLYQIWVDMIQRCENPNCESYKNYGQRDITIYTNWRKSYFNFKEWAFISGYNDNLTIERKEVNDNYCPENWMWVPFNKQPRNRRDSQ